MNKPSVTQLIDLLAKPALINWANKQGLAGIDIAAAREKSKKDGSSIHSQIEAGVFDKAEDAEAFSVFMSDKELIDQERKIETEWFVGRYDARLLWGGKTCLVDYKKSDRPVVYFEHKLQLAGYAMGVEAERFAIVAAPSFRISEIFFGSELQKYQRILVSLSRIWSIRKELGS